MEVGFHTDTLTGDGGIYEVSPSIRELLCLGSDGTLYIAEGKEQSYWVLSFIDRLRRDSFQFKPKTATLEQIAKRYRETKGKKSLHDTSTRQAEVIKFLKGAVAVNASDIHLIVKEITTTVQYRIDGELKEISSLSASDGSDLCSTIYQTMCDVAEPVFNPHRSQDARLAGAAVEACKLYGGRVATRPTDNGLLMVIRLLYDKGENAVSLEALGYTQAQMQMIMHMASRRFGINILSGPTGSGKSTTLECILKQILKNREGRSRILTLEDPPEYKIPGAVQTPILCDKDDDDEVSREWARAIANAMRLDPDILMCGEIRDLYSATATFRAAMTGHGVWTTVHANDALSILTRLQDIGISRTVLGDASLIRGLISQVLVKRLCDHCKQPYEEQKNKLRNDLIARIQQCCNPEKVFLRGEGCEQCKGKGITGRTVVAEALEPTSPLMDCFLDSGKNAARRFWLQKMHGKTKNQVLIDRINAGEIDPRDGESDVCILDDDIRKEGGDVGGP